MCYNYILFSSFCVPWNHSNFSYAVKLDDKVIYFHLKLSTTFAVFHKVSIWINLIDSGRNSNNYGLWSFKSHTGHRHMANNILVEKVL
jgi:hypothetical protein